MRTPRVYINQNLTVNSEMELPKDIQQHLVTVIKRKVGHNIVLFNSTPDNNNQYGEYLCEIIDCKRNAIKIKVLEYTIKNTKAPVTLELAQCISKGAHFDVALQKSVELGVNIITPIINSRSEQTINDDNMDKKLSRWQKIIISACEQSGRTDIPVINKPIDINKWVLEQSNNSNTETILLTLCTKTNNKLSEINFDHNTIKDIKIIIGPEGGFSEIEVKLLEQNKFNLVKLGNRIMRTETAAIASIAIAQYLSGGL